MIIEEDIIWTRYNVYLFDNPSPLPQVGVLREWESDSTAEEVVKAQQKIFSRPGRSQGLL